jgi:hypothetical protein
MIKPTTPELQIVCLTIEVNGFLWMGLGLIKIKTADVDVTFSIRLKK